MKNIAKIKTCYHLWRQKINPNEIAKELKVHRATVFRWIKKIKTMGIKRTIKYYKNCKKRERRKIPIQIHHKVYKLRDKYHNCCGEKLKYYLEIEEKIKLSVSTIYRILRKKYKLSSKYKWKKKYGEAPKGKYERDVVQVDTVDFGEIYAFTYVDTYTRQAFVDLGLSLQSEEGYATLREAKKIFKKVRLLQTDGGPEFKGEFKKNVEIICEEHRVSRPYKKNEQSFIESFNRTLRKECLGWGKYTIKELPLMKRRVKKFLKFYNDYRPHISIGMRTPNSIASCRI